MNEEAQELLMMFIADSYRYQSGKPCKKTVINMMGFVAKNKELSQHINNSDFKSVLNYKLNP